MYADSVYPGSQMGASGMAFEAGVKGKNLTEWQYGLASVAPRWNVSGTYMQVLPRFLSTESDGSCPREFLFDYFSDKSKLLSLVFLKGYQWPFDVRKVSEGSSIIDILVYLESRKGRRVYLDFRSNPMEEEIDYESLSEEARSYLKKAGACFGTPIDRLIRMNQPAVDFYREHGVDLCTQRLEIALCAQHNNGGLSVNCWWETKALDAVHNQRQTDKYHESHGALKRIQYQQKGKQNAKDGKQKHAPPLAQSQPFQINCHLQLEDTVNHNHDSDYNR